MYISYSILFNTINYLVTFHAPVNHELYRGMHAVSIDCSIDHIVRYVEKYYECSLMNVFGTNKLKAL